MIFIGETQQGLLKKITHSFKIKSIAFNCSKESLAFVNNVNSSSPSSHEHESALALVILLTLHFCADKNQ